MQRKLEVASYQREVAKLVFDDYKQRVEIFWRLFFRAVLAVVTVNAIPFLYAEQLSKTKVPSWLLLLFPLFAMAITVGSAYALRQSIDRYERMGAVHREFMTRLIEECRVQPIAPRSSTYRYSMGRLLVALFTVFFLFNSVVVFLALWNR